MDKTRFRQFRPFKVIALFMVLVAILLTIVSLAGPDWVCATFHNGDVKSWGLWEQCSKVHESFELCVNQDWLFACATLVVLSLSGDVVVMVLGVAGLSTRKRLLFFLAGLLSLVSILCLIISLIVYTVKFKDEVRDNERYNSEISKFAFDWTYGVAWGAVFPLICASIFFFIYLPEEHQEVQDMKSAQHHFYEADNTASFS